jgi:acyl transferase domain-containing protein/phosphopantetheinyl transferase
MNSNDVAVVGMGCVFPRANDLSQYWANLVNGVDCVSLPPPGRWGDGDGPGGMPQPLMGLLPHLRGGFLAADLRLDLVRFGIMPKVAKSGEPEQMLMIHVIDQALHDAGVGDQHPLRERTDVILGRGGYINYRMGEFYFRIEVIHRILEALRERFPQLTAQEMKEFGAQVESDLSIADPDHLPSLIPNLVASRAANRLNLRGEAYVIDAACASSLIAVEQAVERLRLGRCDLAIAGGVHLCQIPAFWKVFHLLQALSPTGQIRPFDRKADGLLLGEGAGAVVLKRAEDARRDGDRVYAIVKGVGSSSDGRETAILAPSVAGQVLALDRGYADAQVDRDTIGFLEAHGTATVVGDRAELETIRTFFGRTSQPTYARALGSVKANIGHSMPAAGIASFIKVALCLANKIWPPSLHCQEPRPELADLPFFVNTQTRPWLHPTGQGPRRAGINSFGFGGINVHAILEEVPDGAASDLRPRPARPGIRQPTELLVFAAATPQELVRRLDRVTAFCERADSDWELPDLAYTLTGEIDASEPCKLALVAASKETLTASLARCRQGLLDGGLGTDEAAGVFYATDARRPPGRVAFLFPGMAFPGLIGNYPQHLIDLAAHFPEVRAELDRFEGKDQHAEDPIPFSTILSPPPCLPVKDREQLKRRVAPPRTLEANAAAPSSLPVERNLAGVGVLISNWIGWVLLRQLRVPVDITCGHSAGELTALCSGGLLDFETHVRPRLWEGLAINPRWMARGCLAFVNLTAEQLQPFLNGLNAVQIAVHVAPDSQVVGGPFDEIEVLVRLLRKQGILAQSLPFVPAHTSRMTFLRDEIIYGLDDNLVVGQPSATVFSSLTAQPYPTDARGLRELLLGNLDRPVLFWQTNQRLYEEGVRVFVQVGCGTLAANIKSSLPWNDVVATSLDVEYRHPITQLNNLCATLFSAGVPMIFDPLYRHRECRPLALDAAPAAASRLPKVPLALYFDLFGTKQQGPIPMKAATAPVEPSRPATDSALAPASANGQVAPASRLPFLGQVVHYVPGQEIVMERTISLDEDLFLEDHHFLHGRHFKPLEECFPVMPMTGNLEMMAENAAFLARGWGLIGFEDVRNFRWVALVERRSATCRLRVRRLPSSTDDLCRLQAEIQYGDQTHASAEVLFAPRYRQTLPLQFHELQEPTPHTNPRDSADMYARRFAFHGPRFQAVSDIGIHAANGFAGELTVLRRDNLFTSQPDPQLLLDFCTFDGAGQLFGLWLQVRDMTAFPLSIKRIEIYHQPPPPGSRLRVRGEVIDAQGLLMTATANLEIVDEQGWVWMRVEGWVNWIQTRSRALTCYERQPQVYLLSLPVALPQTSPADVCVYLSANEWSDTTLSFLGGVSLTKREWQEYRGLNGQAGRTFLLGRIAAKDAARLWYMQRTGRTELDPLALEIVKDARGRPLVQAAGLPGPWPQISIAHTGEHAVALATEVSAGIDIEMSSRNVEAILVDFATAQEQAILRSRSPDGVPAPLALRLWCAKEALGKALGSGLNGRPKDFCLREIADDQTWRLCHTPTDQEYTVITMQYNGCIVSHARV